ncbi:MAG: hypothetical protein LPK85_01335 [Gammaproteobacteria bacterium]|nr:hypothetical protein [Gammaproteobacteria bacterium]
MSFLFFLGMLAIIGLLWSVVRNTRDALDKQTAIQYEILSLEKRLEELLERLPASDERTPPSAQD